MKKKSVNLNTKVFLNKETIMELNNHSQNAVNGGFLPIEPTLQSGRECGVRGTQYPHCPSRFETKAAGCVRG